LSRRGAQISSRRLLLPRRNRAQFDILFGPFAERYQHALTFYRPDEYRAFAWEKPLSGFLVQLSVRGKIGKAKRSIPGTTPSRYCSTCPIRTIQNVSAPAKGRLPLGFVYDISMRLAVSVLFLMPLLAQQGPTNLKVIKDPTQVMPTMRTFTQGLGVRCDFCHMQGDQASDTKPEKLTARMMYTMMAQINSNFPGGAKVSCYTCHRGAQHPDMAPPAGMPPGR